MAAFHLRLFGHPELRGAGSRPIHFRTRKQLALLVYLALEARGRRVDREALVDLFWPDVDVERGRHSLSQALTALRSSLGAESIFPGRGPVQLRADLRTDLELLSRTFDSGVDLKNPLQDLDSCAGYTFGHWVDGARARIRTAARAALLQELQAFRSLGEVARVHERAVQLYKIDPESDQAACVLAEGALCGGDLDGAVRILRSHLARTRNGNAERPPGRIWRLLNRIEAGLPPVMEGLRGAESRRGRGSAEKRFVGRARETARLEQLWAVATDGKLVTCLVTGPAGIGKSALVHRFATSVATRGWPVVKATCHEVGSGIPFAALADLLNGLSQEPSLGETDPHWLAEASRVIPSLKARFPGIPDPPPASGESVQLRVAEAFYRIIETVTDGVPVLIVIDDWQHIDPASRAVLHVLTRRMHDQAGMVLATRRTPLGSNGDGPAEADDAHGWEELIAVAPLAPSESELLVSSLTGASADQEDRRGTVSTIGELAEGNPYFLEMLVADWQTHRTDSLVASAASGDGTRTKWRPPRTMQLAFSRQHDALSSGARHVLNVLAVAGRAVSAGEIGRLLEITPDAVQRHVLDAIDTGTVRVEPAGVAFKNELHRAFLYYAMSEASRHYLHGQLARMLTDAETGGDTHGLLEASHHFLRAGLAEAGLEAATKGAALSLAHGAPHEAERALHAAIEAAGGSPPTDALLLLVEALGQQGRYGCALEWLEALDAGSASPEQRALVGRFAAEGMVRGRLGDDDAIRRAVAVGITDARAAANDLLVIQALQISAELAADSSDWSTLAAVRDEAAELARRGSGDALRGCAELSTGFCLFTAGHYAAAYRHFNRSATLLDRVGDHTQLIRALNGCGMCAQAVGVLHLAKKAYQRAGILAQRTGDFRTASNIESNLGALAIEYGDLQQAERHLIQGLEQLIATDDNRYKALVLHNIADLRIIQQRYDEAGESLQHATEAVRRNNLPYQLAENLLYRADYFIATERPEEACRLVSMAEHIVGTKPGHHATNFTRLRLFKCWRLGEVDARSLTEINALLAAYPVSIAGHIELAAFSEWLGEQVGVTVQNKHPTAAQMIRATGLMGVAARLVALGLFPGRSNPRTGTLEKERTVDAPRLRRTRNS